MDRNSRALSLVILNRWVLVRAQHLRKIAWGGLEQKKNIWDGLGLIWAQCPPNLKVLQKPYKSLECKADRCLPEISGIIAFTRKTHHVVPDHLHLPSRPVPGIRVAPKILYPQVS